MSEQKLFGLAEEQGRWGFVLLGMLMNVCLGAVYAFSVFRAPLERSIQDGGWGISATQSGLPFMIFLAMFSLFMALAGKLVGDWGPRKAGLLGGSLVGAGWILAGFAPNILWLTLFYGVIGGAGVGIIYGCPIAVAAKWFPDRKGLAVGLTVMGFGLSPLIVAPLMQMLINTPSIGLMRTFTVFGIAFAAILLLLSLPMRCPKDGWSPRGCLVQPVRGSSNVDLTRRQMVRTGSFYALWGTYTIGCLAGLMAIGISSPVGQQVAALTPQMAAISVSVFAVFNGIGRPLFGWLTDKLTPRYAGALSFVLILAASALLYLWGAGRPAVFFVAFCLLWLNLGGWLAIAPTATATLFGTAHYGTNYGLVFTSYGVGALLGNTLAGAIRDALGGYLPVFLPVMALAAVGIVVSLLWLRPIEA
ncbi:MAG TPA: MFS transporter [Candidatus Acetothermia bacterium]|nr:MFS transporter [Candidatus Acetothermia bacterium]